MYPGVIGIVPGCRIFRQVVSIFHDAMCHTGSTTCLHRETRVPRMQVAPFSNFAAEASTIKGSPPRGENFTAKPFVPYVTLLAARKQCDMEDRCCKTQSLIVSMLFFFSFNGT